MRQMNAQKTGQPMENKIYDVAIIGAGVCGLIATITIGNSAKSVLFDAKKGARKLAITGNNRCNITNMLPLNEFIEAYGEGGNFLRGAFGKFFRNELLALLSGMGFETKELSGRVILKNRTSGELANAMLELAKSRLQAFKPFETVTKIEPLQSGNFRIISTGSTYISKTVLLACGGASYPSTGSTGICYRIAKELSHTVVEPYPIEVAFCADNTKSLQGVSLKDIQATLITEKGRKKARGDMIFTHFGVSGPVIFNLSQQRFDKALLRINPLNTTQEELKRELVNYKGTLRSFLRGKIPKRLIEYLNVPDKRVTELSKERLHKFIISLTSMEFEVTKCPLERAFVTAGGISLKEINPQTMESKLHRGVFFCGEMMNIQGPIGGFNLQAAFSTGYTAAKGILERLK